MKLLLFFLAFIVSSDGVFQTDNPWLPELPPIQHESSYRLYFDTYDPVSWYLEVKGDSVNLVLYTHALRSKRLVTSENDYFQRATLAPSVDELIRKLGPCENDESYDCLGLDGSSTIVEKLQEGLVLFYEYWEPEQQGGSALGNSLSNLQAELSELFSVENRKSTFRQNLKTGRYNNGGSEMLVIGWWAKMWDSISSLFR